MHTLGERLTRSLVDRYVIERQVGEGGMATVFLARDIRHDRRVAIKVLREDMTQRMGVERFLREIRTTATLTHPHIVPLLDSGEADGIAYYVMPFIEGESLRDRLDREAQLSVADAVRITCDIASALDYAHRHGFVHRDVKPANILLHENRALVADFGIALLLEGSGGVRLTESGLSLGTPQYMSTEQAMGERHVTGRTDIFALGTILYEMLAGEPPFSGETAQAIVAKMMTTSPVPIRDVRPTVPAYVAAAIDGALQKVAADRFGTAAEFAHALQRRDGETTSVAAVHVRGSRRTAWMVVAGTLVVATAAGVGAVIARSLTSARATNAIVARAVIPLAQDQLLVIHRQSDPLDISRDGKYLVYVGDDAGKSQLFLRPLADTITRAVPGTAGATTPFFSADGEWIAFFADDKLKKVTRSGGAPIDVLDIPAPEFGATWGSDGNLLFAVGDSALYRVRSDGTGAVEIIAEPKLPARRHALGALRWPALLPDNARAMISTDSGIGVMDLASGEVRIVLRGRQATYLPTEQLLFDDNEGRVRVVGFDVQRGTVQGASTPVFEAFRGPGGGATYFAVSDNGTLVYMPGGFQRSLVRVNRYGQETSINAEPRGYRFPNVSPDGKSVVVTVDPRPSSIWIVDATTGQAFPLTTDRVNSIIAVWSPDGTRVAFSTPQYRIGWMTAQPGSQLHPVFAVSALGRLGPTVLTDWTDAAGFLGIQLNARARADIVQFRMGDSTVSPVVSSPAEDRDPALSPDGKWLAYASDISGASEVYVRPYPQAGPVVQVSARGGAEPRWSRDGKEIVYRSGSRIMSVVHRSLSGSEAFGAPQLLFNGAYDFSQDHNWTLSPDGSFIMIKADPTTGRQLRVAFNWFDELRATSKAK
ncbi:protein kinase domain-containing protein [Gemmatimonas sp.]|uniref:protein kinase domain-containing protein n=1 Tax=Gemmatimonas sp. TaxID=1962908 RepID=UPI0039835F84